MSTERLRVSEFMKNHLPDGHSRDFYDFIIRRYQFHTTTMSVKGWQEQYAIFQKKQERKNK